MAIAPLLVAIALDVSSPSSSAARRFRLGVLTGVIGSAITLYWVSTVMAMYASFSSWLAVGVGAILWFYLAIFIGLFAITMGVAIRRFGVSGVWLAPAAWVAFEWLRSWFMGGFPWAFLGASQATVPLIVQLASLVGVYGLSALVALVSSAAAALALSQRPVHVRGAMAVGALLIVVMAFGMFRLAGSELLQRGRPLRIGLLQGNVEQVEKWDPAYRDAIVLRYLQLSRRAVDGGARLVIWPEASTPFAFDAQSDLAAPIRALAVQSRTPFIIGSDEFEPVPDKGPRIYNSAVLLGADGKSHGTYRKMRLVPFGEYVPMKQLLFFVAPLVEAVSDFSMGTEPTVFDVDGARVSVSICYESIIPWISRAFVGRGSELLATITNDAWFGTSSAPYQHFDQGLVRAVEEGRFVVRAANTGISGVVDPYGRVLMRTNLFEAAAPTFDVRLLDDKTIYSQIGDVAVWFSLVIVGWILVWRRSGISH